MPLARGIFGADALLLLTAAIWGFAFVAQRMGMDHVGPFAFNAARYALGALSLLPFAFLRLRSGAGRPPGKDGASIGEDSSARLRSGLGSALLPSLAAGSCMFLGASLQQLGLVTTTAGNAAFVTSLYVVLVPLIGMFFGRHVGARGWLAALIAVLGLYFITVGKGFIVAPGDLFELAGALFWALHILIIARFASALDPVLLSAGQFAVCGILSLGAALVFEPRPFAGLGAAALPVLYGGLLSCGVAFTLQIFAQRRAKPAHASIILALEGLFGAIGGVLILGEAATLRLAFGGALMLGAAILSQLEPAPNPSLGGQA